MPEPKSKRQTRAAKERRASESVQKFLEQYRSASPEEDLETQLNALRELLESTARAGSTRPYREIPFDYGPEAAGPYSYLHPSTATFIRSELDMLRMEMRQVEANLKAYVQEALRKQMIWFFGMLSAMLTLAVAATSGIVALLVRSPAPAPAAEKATAFFSLFF